MIKKVELEAVFSKVTTLLEEVEDLDFEKESKKKEIELVSCGNHVSYIVYKEMVFKLGFDYLKEISN